MKKPVFLLFVAYVWTKTLLGLSTTPYKSVREMTRHKVLVPVVFEMTRHKVLVPVVFSPLVGLAILFVLGRMGSFVFEVEGFRRTFLALTLSTAFISILLWQLLLLYLLLSFYFGLKKR
ncbi:MAG: hypothetical protein HYV40_05090 [Candidatus Levybacteria bacterium]|nr:hypothetical protein [Candidatus Levybacteria bacterium]